jgi:hypothetical protein
MGFHGRKGDNQRPYRPGINLTIHPLLIQPGVYPCTNAPRDRCHGG